MENKNKICPVCGQYPIYPPHEVCLDCYQRTKNNSGLDEVLKGMGIVRDNRMFAECAFCCS